jgi:hypothetical protein
VKLTARYRLFNRKKNKSGPPRPVQTNNALIITFETSHFGICKPAMPGNMFLSAQA